MAKQLLFVVAVLMVTSLHAQKDSSFIIFIHANLIDGISDKPLKNVAITVKGGKIEAVQKHTKEDARAIVINLSGKWVLPGYIDAHAHFLTLDAARIALTSGVTTARTLRCDHFIDVQIRLAHQHGQLDLPDIVAAGYQIRPDMADAFFEDFPELIDIKPRLSGVDNVRRVVRAEIERKVDLIKILASEKAGTPSTDPLKRTFTDEEINAIVAEAKKANLPVAAHAYGDEAASAAVRGGVRSIEHGAFLSDETLKMMKDHETYFDPTLAEWVLAFEKDQRVPDVKEDSVLRERHKNFSASEKAVIIKAHKMRIPIIGGTDNEYNGSQLNYITDEAINFVRIGIPNLDAIKSITSISAECLQIANHTGAIRVGLDADMVVVDQNPLKEIAALKNILLVVNDGKIAINKL